MCTRICLIQAVLLQKLAAKCFWIILSWTCLWWVARLHQQSFNSHISSVLISDDFGSAPQISLTIDCTSVSSKQRDRSHSGCYNMSAHRRLLQKLVCHRLCLLSDCISIDSPFVRALWLLMNQEIINRFPHLMLLALLWLCGHTRTDCIWCHSVCALSVMLPSRWHETILKSVNVAFLLLIFVA